MDLGEGDVLVGATQRGELDVSLGNGGLGGLRIGAAARLETFRGQRSQEVEHRMFTLHFLFTPF